MRCDSQMLMVRATDGFCDLGECFRPHNLSQGQSKTRIRRRSESELLTDWLAREQKLPHRVIAQFGINKTQFGVIKTKFGVG
jgi:hypothetical protein